MKRCILSLAIFLSVTGCGNSKSSPNTDSKIDEVVQVKVESQEDIPPKLTTDPTKISQENIKKGEENGNTIAGVKSYIGRKEYAVVLIKVQSTGTFTSPGNIYHKKSIKVDTVKANPLKLLYYDEGSKSAFPIDMETFEFFSYEKLIFRMNKGKDALASPIGFFEKDKSYIVAIRAGWLGLPHLERASQCNEKEAKVLMDYQEMKDD